MAAASRKPLVATTDDQATSPPQVLPPDFEFKLSHNIPIPVKVRGTPKTAHAFTSLFDAASHNSAFFVPLAYWLARGRSVEETPLSWQKATISGTFVAWRKKDASRDKLRLTTIAREVGDDPEFPQLAGVRAWVVDTTR